MDLALAISHKQAEADQLSNTIQAASTQLDTQLEVIARLQELSAQSTFSLADINYLVEVGAI
jgi:hypothetical protein